MVKTIAWMRFLLLAGCLIGSGLAVSEPSAEEMLRGETTSSADGYQRWVALSAQGYRQAEIEARLKGVSAAELVSIKVRLREEVLTRLRSRGVAARYAQAHDRDDLRIIDTLIANEIRHVGLELDSDLAIQIRTALISGDL